MEGASSTHREQLDHNTAAQTNATHDVHNMKRALQTSVNLDDVIIFKDLLLKTVDLFSPAEQFISGCFV